MQLIPGFNQILTREGWVEIQDYYNMLKRSPVQSLIIYKGHCIYACPKSFSSTHFHGTLVELLTDTSRIILKPSTKTSTKKVGQFNKGERIEKYFGYQTVEKREEVLWQGNQLNLFYGEPVLLPLKFENDYILLPV